MKIKKTLYFHHAEVSISSVSQSWWIAAITLKHALQSELTKASLTIPAWFKGLCQGSCPLHPKRKVLHQRGCLHSTGLHLDPRNMLQRFLHEGGLFIYMEFRVSYLTMLSLSTPFCPHWIQGQVGAHHSGFLLIREVGLAGGRCMPRKEPSSVYRQWDRWNKGMKGLLKPGNPQPKTYSISGPPLTLAWPIRSNPPSNVWPFFISAPPQALSLFSCTLLKCPSPFLAPSVIPFSPSPLDPSLAAAFPLLPVAFKSPCLQWLQPHIINLPGNYYFQSTAQWCPPQMAQHHPTSRDRFACVYRHQAWMEPDPQTPKNEAHYSCLCTLSFPLCGHVHGDCASICRSGQGGIGRGYSRWKGVFHGREQKAGFRSGYSHLLWVDPLRLLLPYFGEGNNPPLPSASAADLP